MTHHLHWEPAHVVTLNVIAMPLVMQIGQVWMPTTMAPAAHTPFPTSRYHFYVYRQVSVSVLVMASCCWPAACPFAARKDRYVCLCAPTIAARMNDACLAVLQDTQVLHSRSIIKQAPTWSTQLQLLMHSSSCAAVICQFAISSGFQSCEACVTQCTLTFCASWQAANDPIAPAKAIPRQAMQDNPNCILVVTPCGGHLGWVSGPGAPLGQLSPFPLFPVVVVS